MSKFHETLIPITYEFLNFWMNQWMFSQTMFSYKFTLRPNTNKIFSQMNIFMSNQIGLMFESFITSIEITFKYFYISMIANMFSQNIVLQLYLHWGQRHLNNLLIILSVFVIVLHSVPFLTTILHILISWILSLFELSLNSSNSFKMIKFFSNNL